MGDLVSDDIRMWGRTGSGDLPALQNRTSSYAFARKKTHHNANRLRCVTLSASRCRLPELAPRRLAQALGHQSARTPLQFYASVSDEVADRARKGNLPEVFLALTRFQSLDSPGFGLPDSLFSAAFGTFFLTCCESDWGSNAQFASLQDPGSGRLEINVTDVMLAEQGIERRQVFRCQLLKVCRRFVAHLLQLFLHSHLLGGWRKIRIII